MDSEETNMESNIDASNAETHNLTNNNANHIANHGTNIFENENIDSWANITANADQRIKKPTPIQLGHVQNDEYGKVLSLLREKFSVDSFEWIHLRKTAHPRIIRADEQIKNPMMNLLRESGIEFNTYADKATKKTSFIVRGMQYDHEDDNIAAINESFIEYNITGVQSINKFMTPSMKRSDNPNNFYQVVLAAGAEFDNINHIKTIDGFRVKIEKIIGSKTVQCRPCQRFTHVASSCHFKYRCVQCTQTHGPGNCPRLNNKKLPIGCVNCQVAGLTYSDHTANDLVHCTLYILSQNVFKHQNDSQQK